MLLPPSRKIQANLLILLFLSLSQNALSDDAIELEAMHIVAEPEDYFVEEANTATRNATLAPSITWNYAQTGKLTSEFEYNHDTQPYRFDNVYVKECGVIYDQSYDANSFRTNGYIRPDLMAQYRWHNWDLRLNIENLLDKRYVASSIYDDTVVQGNRLFLNAHLPPVSIKYI